MKSVSLRVGLSMPDLRTRCVWLGLSCPPVEVFNRLDQYGFEALEQITACIHQEVSLGRFIHPSELAPLIDRVNVSLRRGGWGASGYWTQPAGFSARHHQGLDVPQGWGVQALAKHLLDLAGDADAEVCGKLKAKALRNCVARLDELLELLEASSGFGRPSARRVAAASLTAAWKAVNDGLHARNMPGIEWTLTIRENQEPPKLRLVHSQMEMPDAS